MLLSIRMYEAQESAREGRDQVREIIDVREVRYIGINPARKIGIPNLKQAVSLSNIGRSGE